jgi:DinB superfamily
MDAIDFFLVRYTQIHRAFADETVGRLTEAQLRGRPRPGINTPAWLLWHAARIEDVGVNGFVAGGPQVLADGWLERLGVGRRDVGTGMSDAEVDALSASIDLAALAGYWDAVTRRTLEVVATLRGADLDAIVPAEQVKRVSFEAGAVAPGAEWLAEFWADGRTRGWVLAQTPLLHVYGHYFEARVAAGLAGVPSP